MRDLKKLKESGASYEEIKEALNSTIPSITSSADVKVNQITINTTTDATTAIITTITTTIIIIIIIIISLVKLIRSL